MICKCIKCGIKLYKINCIVKTSYNDTYCIKCYYYEHNIY